MMRAAALRQGGITRPPGRLVSLLPPACPRRSIPRSPAHAISVALIVRRSRVGAAPCHLPPALLLVSPSARLSQEAGVSCRRARAERGVAGAREMEVDAEAGKAGAQQQQQQGEASTSGAGAAAVAFGRSSSRLGAPGAESFDGALRELKDLRTQLHEAADCCEKAFLGTRRKKKLVLEGTKNYICEAVVAVIDHLGTVSSKLEHKMEEKLDVAPAERKLNFLKQRLLTCEQYAVSLRLLTVRGDPDVIHYHRRYISQPTQSTREGNGASSSKNNTELPEITDATVSGATLALMPYDVQTAIGKEQTMASENLDDSPKAMRRSVSLRAEDVHVILGDQKKKANNGSNILSFLKKTRRHA